MDDLAFADLVDACYRASTDPAGWPDALEAIGRHFGASGAGIVSHDDTRTARTVHSRSLEAADRPYREHWWRHDTRIARAKRLRFTSGDVVSDADLITPEEKRRDPFFQEFGRAHGFDELMGYFARDPLGGMMTVSVPRGPRGGPFEARELRALKAIGAQAARAFALTATLGTLHHRVGDLAHCLEQAEIGVVVLDARERVVEANDAAADLMRDCLHIAGNRALVCLDPGEQAKLDRVLAGRDPGVPASLLRSRDGAACLLVERVRVGEGDRIAAAAGPCAHTLLLLRDVGGRSGASIAPHLEELGLTRAEARVAAFVGRGLTPRDAARRLAISPQTVRVHLRSVYGKLSLHRQSELAALVARIDCMTGRR